MRSTCALFRWPRHSPFRRTHTERRTRGGHNLVWVLKNVADRETDQHEALQMNGILTTSVTDERPLESMHASPVDFVTQSVVSPHPIDVLVSLAGAHQRV